VAERDTRRFQEIDVFRGIAALWVVLFHFVLRYQAPDIALTTELPGIRRLSTTIAAVLPDFGLLPVYWFFMISGFVIIWTLERCETWQDFAVSRISRLYPVYWCAMTLTFLAGSLWPLKVQSYTLPQYVVNLTMLQEILGVPHIDGVYWSLTVELVFYVGMAGLFVLGWLRYLPYLCLLWALACMTNQLLAIQGVDVFWRVQKYALLPQGHFLIAGIMFYQLWRGRFFGLCHTILGLCLVSIFLAYPVTEAVVCVLFFAAFWLAIDQRLGFIVSRPLLWLGSVSYALYLSHQMLGFRLMRTLESHGLSRTGAILAAIGMVLVLAHLLTRLVERPARTAIRAAFAPHKTVTS
jgi:peptidoglycan/LPS O-acetylase OafA/YrhL